MRLLLSLVVMLALTQVPLSAAPDYEPAPENLKAREWFQDAKFGLFVHWGVSSVPGRGEWVMQVEKMSIGKYERYAQFFNPTEFDAAEWVSLVKRAGMKYITITSKHHDGFAMWDTGQNDWNIAGATPYGKDVLKMLAEECHKQGIKLFFYYSQLDWHHPDYFPLGRTGHHALRPTRGDWSAYLDFMDAQLRELLTGYGPIGGIWFDGMWDKKDAEWRLQKTYNLIHELQPAALIGSNHHVTPYPGEDFQMFEKDLPGQNTAGFNKAEVSGLPLESANTINNSWGYNWRDDDYKSVRELIHFLVRSAGANANMLLNVGPRPDGTIQPEFVERLEAMGEWLDENGESIYGTRGGPVPPRNWGVTTHKDGTVYMHVLDPEDGVVVLPDFGKKVASAKLLNTDRAVEYERQPWGTAFLVPESIQDELDTIIVLETE